ncbi:hypothetical protein HYPSUDRAFT_199645 [Hypholoma sublateritium FD-334 SS-4]|uniref:Uncharacterized protein n=1 Tax=Hypholoma sublateritium (strain FD-334 SS-4) TaxID=945553 RepID=A0A0D2MNI3_HYPSF|nr:hypothetical protein HYPSUDRAFT_199645 [Hypholoma sublateritium FD-334 SS-4]
MSCLSANMWWHAQGAAQPHARAALRYDHGTRAPAPALSSSSSGHGARDPSATEGKHDAVTKRQVPKIPTAGRARRTTPLSCSMSSLSFALQFDGGRNPAGLSP